MGAFSEQGSTIGPKKTDGVDQVANMADEPGHDADFDVVNLSIPGEVCTLVTADDLQVTGPCRVLGYVVTVATATAVITIEDSLTAGGTTKGVIPAGAAVGVHNFGGIGLVCSTGAFLNYAASATGTVALIVQLAAGSTIEA